MLFSKLNAQQTEVVRYKEKEIKPRIELMPFMGRFTLDDTYLYGASLYIPGRFYFRGMNGIEDGRYFVESVMFRNVKKRRKEFYARGAKEGDYPVNICHYNDGLGVHLGFRKGYGLTPGEYPVVAGQAVFLGLSYLHEMTTTYWNLQGRQRGRSMRLIAHADIVKYFDREIVFSESYEGFSETDSVDKYSRDTGVQIYGDFQIIGGKGPIRFMMKAMLGFAVGLSKETPSYVPWGIGIGISLGRV